MKALEVVRDVEIELGAAGVPTPRVDAEHLVAHALSSSRSALYSAGPLGEGELARLRQLVARRAAREPLAYVLGEWGFRRLTLALDARALVPRPETEVVVERCLALLADVAEPRVLDVGVGSGAIALALVDEHPGVRVVAVDCSPQALALARVNTKKAGAGDRVELVEGDLLAGVPGPFDLVVSNPPYVTPAEFELLEPEIRRHEPRGALIGTGVGEKIARHSLTVLRSGGWVVLESAAERTGELAAALAGMGYSDVAVTADLARRSRVVEGRHYNRCP